VKRALLLIDHGSRRATANERLACVARLVQRQVGSAVAVHYAHMELASPTVAEAIDTCVAEGVEEVIAHPYFLGPGRHATEDIPRLVAEAAARHQGLRYRVTEPLGVHPGLGEVVLDRAGLAAEQDLTDHRGPQAGAGCTLDPATCSEPWCRC
jgi:sirohydrochlorin ferrochelatase